MGTNLGMLRNAPLMTQTDFSTAQCYLWRAGPAGRSRRLLVACHTSTKCRKRMPVLRRSTAFFRGQASQRYHQQHIDLARFQDDDPGPKSSPSVFENEFVEVFARGKA